MGIIELLSRLEKVRSSGDHQWTALCPAHDDKTASLSIGLGDDGRILLHCHAGCAVDTILGTMGLSMKDLYPDAKPERIPTFRREAIVKRDDPIIAYAYGDGVKKFRRGNGKNKQMWWGFVDKATGEIINKKPTGKLLYTAGNTFNTGDRVFLVEGEKDVDTLTSEDIGLYAASGPDGAGPGKWKKADQEKLRGCNVYVIPDHDQVGRDYAVEVCNSLLDVANEVKLLDLSKVWPEIPEHGDVTDMMVEFGPEDGCIRLMDLMHFTPLWHGQSEFDQKQIQVVEDLNGQESSKKATDPEVFSVADLQNMEIPPTEFIVDGLLPVGLAVLGAPSKYGKSWMCIQLSLAVAEGAPFMGWQTNKADVLYMALEDSKARLKERVIAMYGQDHAWPEGFRCRLRTDDLDNGLTEQMANHLKKYPNTKLFIIDTLAKVRGVVRSRENAYQADYKEAGKLKAFADEHGVCVLVVTHLRKMKDDGDWLDRISGSVGVVAASDTIIAMFRERREDKPTQFNFTGRDVSGEYMVQFNDATCQWEIIGSGDRYETNHSQNTYSNNPFVTTIKALLDRNIDGWSGTASEFLTAVLQITGTRSSVSARSVGKELEKLSDQLWQIDRIEYTPKNNGTGGKRHSFRRSITDDDSAVDTLVSTD